jgi:hypothetical protein
MVRLPAKNRERSIELFIDHDPGELMREGEGAQAPALIGRLHEGLVQPVRSP